MEYIHQASGKERGDDFKRRVFGGRADQCDDTVLDAVQERVLLRLVEAVDLVYK